MGSEKCLYILDTNVLISSVVFGGKPRDVFTEVLKGRIKPAISKDILDEMEGVLSGKKFQYPKPIIRYIRSALEDLAEFVTPETRVKVIEDDPNDNRILECGLEAKADFIISGDHHLLELKEHQGIRIITPSDLMKGYCK